MTLPQMLCGLLPILGVLGFLLWRAFGLSMGMSALAGLGMAAVPVGILAFLVWNEKR